MSIERIVEGLERREPAALARAISLVENQRDGFERLLSHVHPGLGRGAARRIGVTGPPGVGQTELDVARTAESTVLVLVPESGDVIQTLKAGVMEIADIYVINKSDRPGADKLRQEVEVMLGIRRGNAFRHVAPHRTPGAVEGGRGRSRTAAAADGEWEPPVLATVASQGDGVDDLVTALDRHYGHLQRSGTLAARRRERLAQRTRAVLERAVHQWITEDTRAGQLLAARLDDVADGRRSPYDVAAEILDQVKAGAPR